MLAMWEPGPDPPADVLASQQRSNALNDRILRALRDADAPLLLGTDTGNPFVVPGFSVHEELELLVQAGLTPYQALRSATRNPAEFLGATGEFGSVAAGRRADLLLLGGNPLIDVRQVANIHGVMARGRWIGPAELAGLLAQVAAFAKKNDAAEPFADMPALGGGGKREFAGSFEIVWRGARFGIERVLVERGPSDQRVIHAHLYDLRYNQRSSLRLDAGAAGDGEQVALRSDGSKGRGEAALKRDKGRARITGTLLSGPAFEENFSAPDGALLDIDQFLAGKALVSQKILDLPVGKEREVRLQTLSLGSAAELSETSFRVARAPDTALALRGAEIPARRYEMIPERGPKNTLWLDPEGWPLAFEIEAYGAPVRFNRIE
jgi:hypothetical protein